ncbi:hypothetical protein F5B22DRAFT_618643 [Xylaria bambusicola]|uniref:uncharacterized protein n=1 Tax=Xylaria bambusicola TaxID=326684 RepID=UPI0020087FB0|nr:uncharacterized protein F5B22DRAFT_618643 [Xylaria bambusicola]KAI0508925.1 hypothetical protein F5B22DRAFT_618643 [Xylaria bambusicola]
MDPLTIIGAAASVGQLVDLAGKAATSAWNLTQSIIQAPEEITKLAEKLNRFKLLIEQTQNQRLDASSIDELFPSDYRDVLYKLLESSVKALENLESVKKAPLISSINVKGRVRWAAIDKRKARDLLADIRDAENSLDTALSMATMRIVSRNQVSLAALRTSQEMFQPLLINELTKIKQMMDEQLSNAVDKITIRAEATVGESQNRVKADLNEVACLIKSIVASGETHSDMLRNLTDLQRDLNNDVNYLKTRSPDQRSQALASRRQMRGAGYFKKGDTVMKAQRFDTTHQDNLAGSSVSTAMRTPISMQILRYEMKRTRQSLFWQSRSSDTSPSKNNALPKLDMSVEFTSSQVKRKLHFVLRAGIRLIRQQMIQFNLTIQHDAKHWMSLPRLGLSLRPIYIRPADAPIFQACHDWDLEAVRYLLDTGQATIYDVDSELRRGLLEHAFRTRGKSNPGHTEAKLQLLMHYLLDVGYDPNVFNGSNSLPAILYAFYRNKLDSVTQLIHRGAEIDSFSANPTSLFLFFPSRSYFLERFNILVSIGFSDWKVESGSTLVHAAALAGDWECLLFALEIVGLVPRGNERLHSPLFYLSIQRWIDDDDVALGAALVECGADINDGRNSGGAPLLCSSVYEGLDRLAHFSLYCGANPGFTNGHSVNAWYEAWECLLRERSIQFVRYELLLTHLLLHGADPFEPTPQIHHDSVCDEWGCNHTYSRYTYNRQVVSPEFARAWSFSSGRLDGGRPSPCRHKMEQEYEAFEVDRVPRTEISWYSDGIVERIDPVLHEDEDADGESEVSDEDYSDSAESDSQSYDEESMDTMSASWDSNDSCDDTRDSNSLFYQNISTAEGRQRMSTFPAVQLLCNALNRAGYRAEMDSEGDIWFEDEDGDKYYDAVEFQSDTESHEPKDNCYICGDMRKYGLGRIPDDIERGKQKVYTYREEVKAGKRKWCI